MDIDTVYYCRRASLECLSVALQGRDAHTRTHCDRVVALADELGRHCSLAENELRHLYVAALFHDVGKIGVPDRVLLKRDPLSAEDWVLMKEHSTFGEELFLATGHDLALEVAPLIRHHHESFDGRGYPDGLDGERIPLACRVLALVDAYDAITNTRPYHAARSHETAMGMLENEVDRKFDPAVFDTFSRMIDGSAARAP